jgi:hypothetical protein
MENSNIILRVSVFISPSVNPQIAADHLFLPKQRPFHDAKNLKIAGQTAVLRPLA